MQWGSKHGLVASENVVLEFLCFAVLVSTTVIESGE